LSILLYKQRTTPDITPIQNDPAHLAAGLFWRRVTLGTQMC